MINLTKKHLIALDLDGTLLNDEKTISPLSVKVLKALEMQGNLVVICSGRALRSVSYYHDFVGLVSSPVICYNGHLAINPHDDSFTPISHILNKDSVKNIYKELIDKKLINSAMSENTSTIYCDIEDSFLFAFYDKNQMEIKDGPLDKIIDKDVFTCVIKFDDTEEKINEKEIIKVVSNYDDVSVRFWFGGSYCELFGSDVSKSKAIKELADYYHVDYEDIIVFGDSDNDIEMLHDYKHSYLMKNGNPSLKNVAKHITDFTNNDDGVARELIKLFNIRL